MTHWKSRSKPCLIVAAISTLFFFCLLTNSSYGFQSQSPDKIRITVLNEAAQPLAGISNLYYPASDAPSETLRKNGALTLVSMLPPSRSRSFGQISTMPSFMPGTRTAPGPA